MPVDMYTRSGLVLLAIVFLLLGFAWVSRRFGLAGRILPSSKRRLAVIEALALDNRRRVVLLRRDGVEHLVLLSPDSAVVIEHNIPAASDFPQVLAEKQQLQLPRTESPK